MIITATSTWITQNNKRTVISQTQWALFETFADILFSLFVIQTEFLKRSPHAWIASISCMHTYVIARNLSVLRFRYLAKYLWKPAYLPYVISVDKSFKLSCMFYLANRSAYIWHKGYKSSLWPLTRCSDRFGFTRLWNRSTEVNR